MFGSQGCKTNNMFGNGDPNSYFRDPLKVGPVLWIVLNSKRSATGKLPEVRGNRNNMFGLILARNRNGMFGFQIVVKLGAGTSIRLWLL